MFDFLVLFFSFLIILILLFYIIYLIHLIHFNNKQNKQIKENQNIFFKFNNSLKLIFNSFIFNSLSNSTSKSSSNTLNTLNTSLNTSNSISKQYSNSNATEKSINTSFNSLSHLNEEVKVINHNEILNKSYGYVFLLFGDITKICCDCWLGSSGARLDVRSMSFFPDDAIPITVAKASGSSSDGLSKIVTYSPWPFNLPIPYTIMLKSKRTTELFVEDTERYIRIAARDLHDRGPQEKLRKNVCPLIATTLIGTGYGGNFSRTGEMLKLLLPKLYSLAEELKIDIALVFIDKEMFTFAQFMRRKFLQEQEQNFTSKLYQTISGYRYLQSNLIQKILELASYAMKDELTLFVGAGVSMGAGLPSWAQLLSNLARKMSFTSEELYEFESLDFYSRAAILEQRLAYINQMEMKKMTKIQEDDNQIKEIDLSDNDKNTKIGIQNQLSNENNENKKLVGQQKSLYDMIAEETCGSGYSVMHSLIASLPIKEVICIQFLHFFLIVYSIDYYYKL